MANPDVRIFLVGNKADLEEARKITRDEGEKYKIDQNLDLFMETSAKTGFNAKNVLIEAAKILYKDFMNLAAKNGVKGNNKDANKKKVKIEKK